MSALRFGRWLERGARVSPHGDSLRRQGRPWHGPRLKLSHPFALSTRRVVGPRVEDCCASVGAAADGRLYFGERETLLPVGNDEDGKCPRKLSAARLERSMRIDSLRTTATACAALLLAAAAWSDSAAPADLARFEGEWTRSAREQNDTDRAAAIDRSMEHMPFWARGFASALMRASISPPERYTILVTLTGLSIGTIDAVVIRVTNKTTCGLGQ